MAPIYLIIALLIQSSLTYGNVQSQKNETEPVEVPEGSNDNNSSNDHENPLPTKVDDAEERTIDVPDETIAIPKSDIEEVLLNDFRTATNDWVDTFLGSSTSNPTSSASIMAQALNSNKSPEEQLEEIKEVASEITMAIQSEMTNLLSYALNYVDKDQDDGKLRKKRSVETPMDSSQLIMRLLQHIKSNNEYQNIAIEKMMSAQEIADKYGVEFSPDPEILSDLAIAANEQANELATILKDACDSGNVSCSITNSTDDDNQEGVLKNDVNNTICYIHAVESKDCRTQNNSNNPTLQGHEHNYQSVNIVPANHVHYSDDHAAYNYYNYGIENQISAPASGASVSTKPTFYDTISYNPNEYYAPYCSMDQMAYPMTYPFEEPLDLGPELVGEEFEETVSSRVIIEEDEEPGSATVNHIMTYTVSEKAHFRKPQIEKLPQQMQYYFYLI